MIQVGPVRRTETCLSVTFRRRQVLVKLLYIPPF